MSGNRSGTPPAKGGPGRDPRATVQANADALAWYVATIDVTPPHDLASRTLARVRQEPRRTPPGRLLAALASFSPSRIRSAFARNLDAAAGRMATAPLVRAQAIALVTVLVLSVGALGTAGAVVLRNTLDRQPVPPTVAAPSVAPSPSPSPTVTPSPSPTPTATPPATLRFVPTMPPTTPFLPVGPDGPSGTATPGGRGTPSPGRTDRPRPTPRADRTPRPDKTRKPERTQKPRPTPKADRTQKPRPTRKPARTP
ncbi:MAG: hypothetical protein ABWZ82_00260, partial [Candidatus Limnocylindrales bacterium]